MVKDILDSLPVLIISIVATITGGTAVSKVAQQLQPALTSDNRGIQEVHVIATTPTPFDDFSGSVTPTPTVTDLVNSPSVTPNPTRSPITASANTYTLTTLAQHKSAGNCFVAYKGIVYNVSNHPSWQTCTHHGTSGGRDITSIFPHSTSYFSTLPKVGILKSSTTSGTGTTSSSNQEEDDDDDESEDEVEHEEEEEDEFEPSEAPEIEHD